MKAWRVWNISLERMVLVSALDPKRYERPTYWLPGRNAATCKFSDHHAPDDDCRCGFRGQPDIGELIGWCYDFKHVDATVIGGVGLSGKIIAGDKAHPEIPRVLRAEYAEVTGPLFVRYPLWKVLGRKLAGYYGVTVLTAPSVTSGQWFRSIPEGRFTWN